MKRVKYKSFVQIRTTSEVISATCTCPAGGTPTFCKQENEVWKGKSVKVVGYLVSTEESGNLFPCGGQSLPKKVLGVIREWILPVYNFRLRRS
ncbi:hypothetical protein TNCT_646381 [Trichonephila clavata]|uniref:Uncharacterized protein n=2 Tax=Trichonephila clavata TaxID=2740835 RepID=A0A8X6LGH3_TRICU|nr:hypothetical protein TNCT_646381 [Trichonephila clavata]